MVLSRCDNRIIKSWKIFDSKFALFRTLIRYYFQRIDNRNLKQNAIPFVDVFLERKSLVLLSGEYNVFRAFVFVKSAYDLFMRAYVERTPHRSQSFRLCKVCRLDLADVVLRIARRSRRRHNVGTAFHSLLLPLYVPPPD